MITRGIQSAANGMKSLLDMNDTIANNLANVNTVGFKKAALTFKNIYDQRIEQPNNSGDFKNATPKYVGNLSVGSVTDRSILAFSQGTLDRTGNPTDLALQGDGFFKVRNQDGKVMYTRNGQFALNNKNMLVTRDGEEVLDIKDKPIHIDLAANNASIENLMIKEKGDIQINDLKNPVTLQTMAIVDFSDKENLISLGNGKYAPSNPAVNPELKATKFDIQQGAIELSNSNTITEMINSINVSRNYETLSKVVKEEGTLLDTAINLGRVRL